MEQILVNRRNGTSYLLEDRNELRLIKSIVQKVELRANDIIDVTIESRDYFNFTIGDSFTFLERNYTLNQTPKIDKIHSKLFQYSIQFEGIQFDLRRASYDVNIDTTGSAIYGETLTADLELFLRVLITNANRVFPGKWVLGNFPAETEIKTLTFSEEENCLNVLQTLCTEYDYDFVIKSKNGINTLHIQQVGEDIPLEFKVGFQKGLYNLSRDKVDSNDIVTRLKVYGSDKNLGASYRSNRLVLAGKNKPNSFIDNTQGIDKYGIYEQTKIFDEVYPRRKGKVTAINSGSIFKFSDSSMDFDLKEREEDGVTTKYLLNGVTAKIHFNTGNLAGYEFEVKDYNHTTKEFTIIKFTDENDYQFPSNDNNVFRVKVGDEYVILDIKMPQSYIDAAESELLQKGTEFLTDKQEPLVQYTLDIDTLFLQRQLNKTVTEFFSIGDFVKVVDEDLELNRYIRIKSIERDLTSPFDYKLTLSDAKVITSFDNALVGEINNINNIIKNNNLKDPAKARRNWRDSQEVLDMVFDTEGDYYTEKIKPNSIETQYLQVGAKSMQFNLVNSYFSPNYNGNPNLIAWTSCQLVHLTIEDEIRTWNISNGTKTLAANEPYYMYAKCNKANNLGIIEITTEQFKVDDSTDHYYFLIGIVNSYNSEVGAREISMMYGFSDISGRFIKTGRIQSADGETYFDLDSGEIKGKIVFTNEIGGRNYIDYSKIVQGIRPSSSGQLWSNNTYVSCSEIIKIEQYSDFIFYIKSKTNKNYRVGIGLWNGTTYLGESNYINFSSENKGIFNSGYANGFTFNIYIPIEGQINLTVSEVINDCLFKLEKGNISTDFTNNPDEVEKKVSFLNTTIDGNAIATGMMIVGNESQANAGVSGLNEAGPNSVRFWAGGTFENRDKALWQMRDNAMEICYHPNGILARERGYDGEKWVDNMYNEQGWILFQLDSKRGLVPVPYTEESFTPSSFINTNQTNPNFEVVKQNIINLITDLNNLNIQKTPIDDDPMYTAYKKVYTRLSVNLFNYYNGTHPNNSQYEIYRGWKKSMIKTDNVINGWYVKLSTAGGVSLMGEGYIGWANNLVKIFLQCEFMSNGIVTQTNVIVVEL